MSVRKRTWATRKGEQKEAWMSITSIRTGDRHIQTFSRKKDADDYHATVKVDVSQGIHTAQSKSITVAEAAEDWIKYVEAGAARTVNTRSVSHTTLRTTSIRALAGRSWRS